LLLGLNVRVLKTPTGKSLQRTDGVLEVGDLLRLGRLAEIARLGAKAYERTG
jgi:hypothetical protein